MRVKLLHKKFLNLVEVFGKFLATVDDCLELFLFVEVFHQGALYGVEALEYLGDRTFHSLVNLRGLGGYERGNHIVGFFYALYVVAGVHQRSVAVKGFTVGGISRFVGLAHL